MKLETWLQRNHCNTCGRPWTHTSLARLLGVSRTTVWHWLKVGPTRRTPDAKMKRKIERLTYAHGQKAMMVREDDWDE